MKKIIKLLSICAVVLTVAGCTTSNDCPYKQHNQQYKEMSHHDKTQCTNRDHKKHRKLHSKMYTRNNHGEATEIGYVKFYDIQDGVKMVVNVDKLRDNMDYTTVISQCKDAKCMTPDTCCTDTYMTMEMPLTRKDKTNPKLQETFFISNVNTNQLRGATIFFERDKGYRAAWGFLD